MPIPLPNLDDRTYDELTAEARALIPTLHPGWTDHNPSDPGIVLVELLAWLTEMLLFQVNEIPDASTERFLTLLNGGGWQRPDGMTLDEAVVTTIQGLRQHYRAATTADIEDLARHDWPASPEAAALGDGARIARVRAVPRRNLAATDPVARRDPAPAYVSLVVVPTSSGTERYPQPTAELLAGIEAFLQPRRTLTTHLRAVGPGYVDVTVKATVALNDDAPPAETLQDVSRTLVAFFDPLSGGPDGTGWPFGREVYVSEVYATLEGLASVDYVDDVVVDRPDTVLDEHELVRLTTVDLTAYDRRRNKTTLSGAGK
jgi:hypothetical protein